MHDILEYGSELSMYDHNSFPGVVPRTFVGALSVSAVVYPIRMMFQLLDTSISIGFLSQYICRFTLGVFGWLSFREMRKSVCAQFGTRAGALFGILLCLQFHFPYYCSRFLPNTFALILSMQSMAVWMRGSFNSALYIVAVAMVIFRCDMVLLLGPMAMQMVLFQEVGFWWILLSGVFVSLIALLCSVTLDSFFWGRWVYPEGEVLFFNTMENRSSEWGILPWHWYITSALPKGLLFSFPLLLCGAIGIHYPSKLLQSKDSDSTERQATYGYIFKSMISNWNDPDDQYRSQQMRMLYYLSPAFTFVFLYSFLPHKELRFILPVLPVFTMGAAITLSSLLPDKVIDTKNKLFFHRLYNIFMGLFVTCILVGSAFALSFFSIASFHNYPGGVAMSLMHSSIESYFSANLSSGSPQGCNVVISRPIRVHIDVLACVSGVTRFNEERKVRYCCFSDGSPGEIAYSKDESILTADQLKVYDWVITNSTMQKTLETNGFEVERMIDSFKRYQFDKDVLMNLQWPVSVIFETPLAVMRNVRRAVT